MGFQLKVLFFVSLFVITSAPSKDKSLEERPIFEVTTYFDSIFHNNASEASAILGKTLEAEHSTTLYYTTDASIFNIGETFANLTNWINPSAREVPHESTLKTKRNLLISFRFVKKNTNTFNYQRVTDYEQRLRDHPNPMISNDTDLIQALQSSLSGIVLDWNTCRRIPQAHFKHTFIANAKFYFRTTYEKRVKVGIGYNEVSIGCQNLLLQIRTADFLVLTIDFVAEVKFVESYGIFKAYLESILERNKNFIQNAPPKRIILRMNLLAYEGKYNQEFRLYQKLLKNFIKMYQRETKEKIILNVVNDYNPNVMLPLGKNSSERVHNWVNNFTNVIPTLPSTEIGNLKKFVSFDCTVKTKLDTIASKFDTLLLDFDAWTNIIKWSRENHTSPKGDICNMTVFKTPSNILLNVTLKNCRNNSSSSCITLEHSLAILQNNTKIHGMAVKSVIFTLEDGYQYEEDEPSWKIPLGEFSLGCSVNNTIDLGTIDTINITKVLRGECSPQLLERATVFIMKFHLDFDEAKSNSFSCTYYTRNVQSKLHILFESVDQFRKVNPEKELILSFVGYCPQRYTTHDLDNDRAFFCDDTQEKMHLYFEAISNWAKIHKIRVILKPAFGISSKVGWWSVIMRGTSRENLLGYQLFSARNYPSYMNFSSDECTRWVGRLKEQISFEGNTGLGTTLNMGLRQGGQGLTLDELKVMMTFALHLSPRVEILPRGGDNLTDFISDLETLSKIFLDSSFDDVLKRNNISQGAIFIEIPQFGVPLLPEATKQLLSVLSQLGSLSSHLSLEGVHIKISDHGGNNNWKEVVQSLDQLSRYTKVGVSVDQSDFFAAQKIPGVVQTSPYVESDFSVNFNETMDQSIRRGVYLICEVSPIIDSYELMRLSLQGFLDGPLMLKRGLPSMFPNLEWVAFRKSAFTDAESVNGSTEQTANYLTHLFHMNNFAKAYNLSFFIGGFDDENLSQVQGGALHGKEIGWWSIANYSDLSDVSVYTEKQAEHFGRDTWRPEMESKNVTKTSAEVQQTPGIFLIIGLSGLFISVVGSLIFLATYLFIRLKSKQRFLSDEEIKEFYEGRKQEAGNPNDLSNPGEHSYVTYKFDTSFEIPKQDYTLDSRNILGRGQFGTVYKTSINGIPVAVKTPNNNCPKEAFQSMLCEVKILLYLGSHPNLVKFVGCYTKGIGRGAIHIMTELCEQGSLEAHLQRTETETDGDVEEVEDEMMILLDELMRFAFEIASGMEFISDQKVIHGDLAARNVLLDGNLTCKIGDFGLSLKLYEHTKYVKKHDDLLPWKWMSYESLVKNEFTTKSDVWSYGVTLWEIFSLGAMPYPGLEWSGRFTENLRQQGCCLTAPQYATPEIFNKMRECWELESESRPTFSDLRDFFGELLSCGDCQVLSCEPTI